MFRTRNTKTSQRNQFHRANHNDLKWVQSPPAVLHVSPPAAILTPPTRQIPRLNRQASTLHRQQLRKETKRRVKDYLKVGSSWNEAKCSNKEEVWDDGIHSGIDQILLSYTRERVCSIQVAYYDYSSNATSFAPKHGSDGAMFQQLSFQRESPLISVSGHYDSIFRYSPLLGEVPCISSIKFKTSSGETYGPYGRDVGIPYSYQSDSKGLAGFHGKLRSDINPNYLSYLGVYVHNSSATTKAAK